MTSIMTWSATVPEIKMVRIKIGLATVIIKRNTCIKVSET